jgi:two-component system cell cycle sensor histidine kinase/response regulator CckA
MFEAGPVMAARRVGPQMQRGALAVATALALVAIAAGAFMLSDRIEFVPLLAGVVLAMVGIVAILGWIGGLFGFPQSAERIHFYDSLLDAIGDAAVVTDSKGRAVYSNGAFLKLASQAGASRLVGFEVLFAGYPDFAEPIYQLGQAAKSGTPLKRDIRVPAGSSMPGAAADQARWLRLAVAPIPGEVHDGQTLWRLTDISSDRKHQESAFSRLQFIITYLDHAPAGFFSTLPDGRVDYVNATLAEWLGVDLVEAQGGAMRLSQLVGESNARQLSSLAPVLSGTRIESFPLALHRKSGDILQVEIVHRADFDKDGNPMPSRSMVLRREGKEKMASRQAPAEMLRAIMTASPVGVALIASDGSVDMANDVFLAVSPAIKLQGNLASAFDGVMSAEITRCLSKVRGTVATVAEMELLLSGTEAKAVQLTFAQFPGLSGTTIAFALDKTESKTLEVQLAQSQKMQAVGQLASGIAHDFNNVLTPIIGFADLLLAKMRPTDSAFTDVMNIKQNANRAANLVRQLLAFSRKQTMQPRLHSLTEAMSDLGNLLGRVLGEKVELEIVHARDLGHVMVDIHQFEQVIINLAVNARDAMPHGGTLSVKTSNVTVEKPEDNRHGLPVGEYVACVLSDTGTGIPPQILEKIWEPFFSTKEVGKGTGLGLSMVYGIVKQTGGYIYCDSAMGKGTTFTIYLPRHYPEKQPAPTAAPAAGPAKPVREDFTGRGRILIVEDEDSVRAFASKALQSRGYTVVEADSGERGLAAIEADKDGFELILSDVVMPEMDGPTMLAEIRKRGIKTKFIFMSGYAEDAFERNLENPDDFGFLQKPFSLKQLVEKVKEVVA